MNFQPEKYELHGLYCTQKLFTRNIKFQHGTGKHSYLPDLKIVEGSKANGETSCFIRLT